MYRIYSDGQLLYHSNLENLQIFNPSLELELNKTGSFDFTIRPNHPRFSLIQKMKSIITVFQDDYMLFRGRVLDDEIGFHNEKNIFCEGDFAFLLDSILRPFTFTGTVAEFIAYVLTLHNAQVDSSKQFQAGNITVEGSITYETKEYITTKETLEKAVFEPFGGYFKTRFEDGVAYLDYLSEITLLAPQKIEFGKNLIDLKRIRKPGQHQDQSNSLEQGIGTGMHDQLNYIINQNCQNSDIHQIPPVGPFKKIGKQRADFCQYRLQLNQVCHLPIIPSLL